MLQQRQNKAWTLLWWCGAIFVCKRATVRWWKRILFSLRLKVVQGKSKTTTNGPVTSSTDAKLDLTVNLWLIFKVLISKCCFKSVFSQQRVYGNIYESAALWTQCLNILERNLTMKWRKPSSSVGLYPFFSLMGCPINLILHMGTEIWKCHLPHLHNACNYFV